MPRDATAQPEDIRDPRNRQRRRRSSSHWPLPVALVLAIVYWFYLNSQVYRTEDTSLYLRIIQATESLATHGFDIRLPRTDLIVTRIEKSKGGAAFDLKNEQIRVTFRAPGALLKQLHTNTALVADVPDAIVEACRANGSAVFELDKSYLKDAAGDLTPHIVAIEPEKLFVHLGRSRTQPIDLSWDVVKIRYPEGKNWDKRIFEREIRFLPDIVDVEGPDKLIQTSADDKAIFLLDLTKKLDELANSGQNERADVTDNLQIDPDLAEKGVRLVQSVKATVQFAPEATIVTDLELAVEPDWKGSPLAENEFRIDRSVKFEIHSYDRGFTRLLEDVERRRRWVSENLRCFVRPGELDPTLDTSKEDFVAHLTPHFFLYDSSYSIGREFKIQQKSLISISRKSP